MVINARSVEPALITIPASDAAFREHVQRLAPVPSPRALETRLRRLFPRVVVRERTISGAPGWYVYRDGAWSSSLVGDWWDDPRLPRLTIGADGWLTGADPMASSLLGIEDDATAHHFTDFVVPGTLEDSVGLFRIVRDGKPLDATVFVRPLSGDVIAVDMHAAAQGDQLLAVLRLADDVAATVGAGPVGRPRDITFVPATDVAFRAYAQRALERMPEATADGLAIRLRRLYPHATVEAERDGRWVVRRDHAATDEPEDAWYRQPGLPRVRYDAQALILEANEAAEAFFGRSMVGHHWQEFVTPGSTDQVGIMLEILAEVGAAESRFRMPHGDGRLLEFDSYTEVDGEEFVTSFRLAGR